ncbi:MAG: HFX_2341 family transcriptional regulator domain-containing protein [Candidatus Thorarchaeota archaeon]
MKVQIATLGIYANDRVEQVVMKKSTDKVIIVHTENNSDEADALKSRFVRYGIKCECIRVHPWDYEKILTALLETVLKHPDDEIEFNGSCGTRVMTAAVHMAALIIDAPLYLVVEVDGNVPGEVVELHPVPVSMLSAPKKEILRRLIETGGRVESQSELGSRTELGASSISKHISDLVRARYVRTERAGTKKAVEITDLGRMVYRLKQARERKRKRT